MFAPPIHAEAVEFVRMHTRVDAVPFVPELRLHQADDPLHLWKTTEALSGRRDAPLPFWAFPWAGGIAIARYALDHPTVVAGRRVLDLATGSGLVACAAAAAGALEVSANDIDPLAIAAADLNATLNGVTVATVLGDLVDRPEHPAFAAVDVVLAGDIAYEHAMAVRLVGLLTELASRGVEVYVGDPGRPYLASGALQPLTAYEIPVPPTLEDAEIKRTTVWRLHA